MIITRVPQSGGLVACGCVFLWLQGQENQGQEDQILADSLVVRCNLLTTLQQIVSKEPGIGSDPVCDKGF